MINVQFPKLYEWQDVVFQAIKEDDGKGNFYVVKSRRQTGKSILAITVLLYFALKNPNSIGTCIEPTLTQGRRVFKQIISAVGGSDSPLIKTANATLLEMEFSNGSQIIMKSAEQGDSLRGMTVKKSILILDESAFIKKDIFEILYPVVDALRCPILMISTPLFESGEFFERYTLGCSGDKFTKSFDWAKYDTSALLSPEKLEYYRNTMSEMRFRSEYLGEFITDKSYVFGNFTTCYAVSSKPAVYAAVDWATGKKDEDDYTCLILMDEDKKMVDMKLWRVSDPMDTVQQMANILNTLPTLKSITVEVNSLGEVYRSALKKLLLKKAILKEFLTSNESKRRIIEQLIVAFSSGNIGILDEPHLKEQLQHYEIEQTPTGKITYNAQSGFNDDAVMALAICYDAALKYKSNSSNNFRLV